MDEKNTIQIQEKLVEASSVEKNDYVTVADRFRGTDADKHDMNVLGKTQVLRRNFSFITMLGFASTTAGYCALRWRNWRSVLNSIAACLGMTLVYVSIAEMASMSPTAGGQYHWLSEFGPPSLQRYLSYIVGWLCAIGWQVYLAGICFMIAGIIEGLIILNVPDFEPKPFHTTLLTIVIILFAIFFNTFMATQLPFVEGIALVLHSVGFLAIIIPLFLNITFQPIVTQANLNRNHLPTSRFVQTIFEIRLIIR